MKKTLFLALALTTAVSFSITGCGSEPAPSSAVPSSAVEQEQSADNTGTENGDADNSGENNDENSDENTASGTVGANDSGQAEAQKPADNSSSQNSGTSSSSKPSDQTSQNTPASSKQPTRADAQKYIGSSASSLISALGAPASSTYSPSCMGDGEDGELHYNGFTVYTYKEGSSEKVIDVE